MSTWSRWHIFFQPLILPQNPAFTFSFTRSLTEYALRFSTRFKPSCNVVMVDFTSVRIDIDITGLKVVHSKLPPGQELCLIVLELRADSESISLFCSQIDITY